MNVATYRLKVRVGNAEFEAEGAEATVKEQFELFLSTAANVPRTNGTPTANVRVEGENSETKSNGHHPVASLSQDVLSRAFSWQGDKISLRALPRTEEANSDALVLLLYAYLKVHDRSDVLALDLMPAARQSGIPIDRINRHIPMEYVLSAGKKRGTRYSLNNRGIERAETVLGEMFE